MSTAGPFADLPEGSLRVLQITDTHLYSDPGGRLLGLNTLDSLDAVLGLARRNLQHIDFILATGDLVHDASPEGYATLRGRFLDFGVPVYCIPGNHDLAGQMADHLVGSGIERISSAQHGSWSLVFLDSTIEGEDGGELREIELERLERELRAHADQHALICLHHHPVPVGSAWMDEMALTNGDELLELIHRHPQVRGVLWGHVHQEYESYNQVVRFLGSPSTCIQFAPKKAGFGVDLSPPGYRWLALLPDGEIRTGVHRLDSVPRGIDLRSVGY